MHWLYLLVETGKSTIIRHLYALQLIQLERWMSGLSHHPGKVAHGQPCREFESRSLRQKLVLHRIIKHQYP